MIFTKSLSLKSNNFSKLLLNLYDEKFTDSSDFLNKAIFVSISLAFSNSQLNPIYLLPFIYLSSTVPIVIVFSDSSLTVTSNVVVFPL